MNDQSKSPHISGFLNSPGKSFFFLWMPVLVSLVAEPVTGLVDTAFVARLGAEPLAALGVGTVVLSSGLWLFHFLSVGTQTEVSQAIGRKQPQQGRRIASLALMLAGIIGAVVAVLLFLFAGGLATLMSAQSITWEYAVTYIQLRAVGMPALLVVMSSTGVLYGLGDMKTPLRIALGINLLNIGLDALLIFGAGPIPPLGIAGAAIASVISQYCGAIFCGVAVVRNLGITREIRFVEVKRLMNIGRDMLLRTGSMILFLLLVTRLATSLGPEQGAAHQAVRQIFVFTGFFLDGAAVVAQSVIGYHYGSEQKMAARRIAKLISLWSLALGFMLMLSMLAGVRTVHELLAPTVNYQSFFSIYIVIALLQPVASISFITDGIHWGTGDFRYLRNVILFTTGLACCTLVVLDYFGSISLFRIWLVTGVWIVLRAFFGVIRIWPGSVSSPLFIK